MANHVSYRREYVEAMLRAFPDAGTRTIARALHKKHPKIFPDVENARIAVNNWRGRRQGGTSRVAKVVQKPPLTTPKEALARFAMPPAIGSYAEWEPYRITGSRRVLLLYDLHVPYHDPQAITAALDWGRREKADHIHIGGDLVDFYQLSKFEQDPERRGDLQDDLYRCREMLAHIRHRFPKARITFQYGNHEMRLRRFLWREAPALAGMDSLKLPELLDFAKYRVDEVPEMRVVRIGRLRAIHGHELAGGSSVNPARGLFLRGQETAICGHWHVRSQHSEPSALTRSRHTATWSAGCLCFLKPDYRPHNRWGHGAAMVRVHAPDDPESMFDVDNREIIGGVVY